METGENTCRNMMDGGLVSEHISEVKLSWQKDLS